MAAAAGAALVLALPGGGVAATPGCGAFGAQADAQDEFITLGGAPDRNVGRMDPDHDGVACESLDAPYKGYATIGYNRRGGFLYGTATMPASRDGGEPPCMTGNLRFPDTARKVNVFRLGGAEPVPLLGRYNGGAEAKAETARLIWKADKPGLEFGSYYVEIEEKVRLKPYGRNECPAFSSRPQKLPTPRLR